ncbi:hypothetical protein A5621_25035 [Mycobacterium colombiense]|nr:hypothetical protein A5621_25035 [Mycobacterium colombiense]
MVQHGHQHMFVGGEAEKCCPQRNLNGQVETAARRRPDGFIEPGGRPAVGVDNIPTEVGLLGGNDQLLGDSLGRHEQRAQALMTAHHVG